MSELKKFKLSTGDEIEYLERDRNVWFRVPTVGKLIGQVGRSFSSSVENIPKAYKLFLKEFSHSSKSNGEPFLDVMGVRIFLWRARRNSCALRVWSLFEREVFPKLMPNAAFNCFVPKPKPKFPQTVDELPPDVTAAQLRDLANQVEYRENKRLKRQQQARTCNTGDIGKEFKLTAQMVNTLLEMRGIQTKDGNGLWHLTEAYRNQGLEAYNKQPTYTSMVWTEKGRQFVRRLLLQLKNREISLF